jgi:hypothetical protein
MSKPLGDDAAMRMLLPVGRSGWAIAAGYAGLFALCSPLGLIAIILSVVAILDLRKHPEKHGMGRAIFGLLAGILNTLFMIVVLLSRLHPH